jgi:hypothetical protein
MALYLPRPWGLQCLLPDAILSSLSLKRTIKTLQDLKCEGWSATHVEKHGQDVLTQLADYDTDHFKDLKDKHEEKKCETEEHRLREAEEVKHQHGEAKAIHNSQPKPPRPSQAKKSKNVLCNSTVLNSMPAAASLSQPLAVSAFESPAFASSLQSPPVPVSSQSTPAYYYNYPLGYYNSQLGSQFQPQPQALYHQPYYYYYPQYSQPQQPNQAQLEPQNQ